MGYNEQYEAWKKQRAAVEVPQDFADRVMASIDHTRQDAWRLFLLKLAMMAGQSRILRAGAFAFGLAVCLTRLGSMLAIFIPS